MEIDWTVKYRPKKLSDIIGNSNAVKKLMQWAESWKKNNPQKKAVILVGQHGVGKTSLAYALANEYNWNVIELNASEKRNYNTITQIVGSGIMCETITAYNKKLIMFDEADNLFGKEDSGGILAISEIVKSTMHPVILTVNDYLALVRRSATLKTQCEKITFEKLQKTQIVSVLRNIVGNEGIIVEKDVLELIAEHCDGDLRAGIKDLQSLAIGKKNISVADTCALGYRDSKITIFEALAKIFKSKSINETKDIFLILDENPEKLILWVDENLPLEYKTPEDLSKAYDMLSKADLFLGRVKKRQYYGLWAYASALMTSGITISKKKSYYGYTQYRFPLWLVKIARSKAIRKNLQNVLKKLAIACHTSPNKIIFIFHYIKLLVQKNRKLALSFIINLNLEPEEFAVLIDKDVESLDVKELYDEVENIKSITKGR